MQLSLHSFFLGWFLPSRTGIWVLYALWLWAASIYMIWACGLLWAYELFQHIWSDWQNLSGSPSDPWILTWSPYGAGDRYSLANSWAFSAMAGHPKHKKFSLCSSCKQYSSMNLGLVYHDLLPFHILSKSFPNLQGHHLSSPLWWVAMHLVVLDWLPKTKGDFWSLLMALLRPTNVSPLYK